jgi:CBS domain-containing protein
VSAGTNTIEQRRAERPIAWISALKTKGEKMSCCSDVMKPIEASSCCTPKDTAASAAQAMRESNCGCTPVVENKEKLNLVGVVTERDICQKVAADDRRPSEVRVEEIMRPASACCGADDSVEEARRKLDEHQAASLPVVSKEGSCCGTISSHHITQP